MTYPTRTVYKVSVIKTTKSITLYGAHTASTDSVQVDSYMFDLQTVHLAHTPRVLA
eukprot:CAMPEP_0206318068 /NCGR_PEP_ID=MMETSP0106_2-20121207/16978_1 /ASSEMBLY_ACC=CAM_ASM_000206 /TAXON_ID=81532 /ORGANISM="Acanthoeca-like sp., Strain 10tr" /LENGTH=55 /DNA_ID=CAMNT_0053749715 /DNA_START=167 /DNA_END=334 /DNA_ORIENTATION=+